MRQITLDGRIGKDGAKVLQSANGKSYIRFSLANDSFVNGANKTEWFDVSCFDPYIVEKRAKYMTQGRYAIIQGVLNSEVISKNGKIYLNHYVNAVTIELPSFGTRKDDGEEQVSTFTGGTKSAEVTKAPVQEAAKPETPAVQAAPQPQPVVSQSAPAGWGNDDDLPF